MENNTNLGNATEEIVVASSNGCLKKLGIIGGIVAISVAGYFVVKKIRGNKEAALEDDFDTEDLGMLDEDIESEEN